MYSKLDSPGDNITLAEVKFILQKFELRINKNNLLTLDAYGSTVNYANKTRVNNADPCRNQYDRNAEETRRYNQVGGDQVAVGAGSNERAKGRFNQKLKVICQKAGHIVLHCYHRFDVHCTGNNRMSSETGSDEGQKSSAALYMS